jgi:integrase/recombinase XerD
MKANKPLSPAALAFVDGLKQDGASEGTISAYSAGLKTFERFDIAIDSDVLINFRARLAKRFAPATRALYMAALRKYLTHLVADGSTFDLPRAEAKLKDKRIKKREGYRHKRPPEKAPNVVTAFDVAPAIPAGARWEKELRLEWLRNRAMLHTLYASAGRISEVLSLTRKDVASGRASEVKITGKGSIERMLFLTPEAQAAIRAYCDARNDTAPALFISHRKGKGDRLSRRQAWKIVKDAGKKVGVNMTPHLFRHYRATQLLNEGMPLESVQAYLGHASPETTRIVYAHTKTDVLRDQLNNYGISPKDAAKNATRPS